MTCQGCNGIGHTALKCPTLEASIAARSSGSTLAPVAPSPDTTGTKRPRGPADDEDSGDDDVSNTSEVPACSVCEAPTDEECSDIEEESCVNAYDRKREIQKKKRKTSKSTTSAGTRATASSTTKPKGERAGGDDLPEATASALPPGPIEPDRILKLDDDKLVKLTAEDVVGVPEVWCRWLMRRPVGERPDAWKVFIKTVNEFFKVEEEIKAGDRISGIDVAHAKRILKALESSMDPEGGADVRALQKRLEKSIAYFSGELFAFQTARQDGWKVARSAEDLLKRTHTVPRARQQALARARKAEGAAGSGKTPAAATAASKPPAKGGWAARRNAAKAAKNAKGGTA